VTRSPHRLIHASAGTGKTWQLSGRYLELLLAGVEPHSILATTFTRKAAGEIQDRVLERLAEAVRDPRKLEELGDQIGKPLAAAEVEALLARLTRRLDQMRVRTLDAFFVHLAKLFALELGLPSDWHIVEDAEEKTLRREAVARTLARTGRTELLVLLRGLQRTDASRSVEYTLLREVEEARNAFLESHPEAWDRIRAPDGVPEGELERAVADLGAVAVPRTKQGSPRKHWQNAQDDILEAIAARDWNGLMEVTLVQRVQSGEPEFDREPIGEEWAEPIRLLLQQAAHELVQEVVVYNRASLGWLQRFEESFEELKAEERAYRFEDLPKALHPRDSNRMGAEEQIWYRLDGRIDHLLLDEFQDTAPVQWRILEHLAEEILADGTGRRSFFCVGDLKQSIYGFREAEPRLLAGLGERYRVLERRTLNESYRSSQVVLDTVGRVFSTIGSNAAFDTDERIAAARAFQEDFDEHRAAKVLPGAAFLLEAPAPKEKERDRENGKENNKGKDRSRDKEREEAAQLEVLRLAVRRARAIADEAPGATIGILLRRNAFIARTIFLLRDAGLRASGEGGNPLTDSAAVLHFLSLLHLADHPGDSAAAFHVASSPLARMAGLTAEGYLRERALAAEATRERLAREGYGAFAASFVAAVDEGYGTWDRRRFRQLVDLAHAHDERSGLRADAFVEHVRLTPVEDPAATQVQVMTVHSAKGLEFDAVILPELDTPFLPQRSELLTKRPAPAGLLEAVSHAPSEEVCRMEGVLEELWIERERRELREALCLLYVAMTRARHRLEMVVQHRKDPAKIPHNFAGVLRAALGAFSPAVDGVLWEHPENSRAWFRKEKAPAAEPARSEPRPRPFRAAPARAVLAHRTPSAAEGGGATGAAVLLRSPRSAARVGGELVHRWLREVEWLEDFAKSDEELLALGREITSDEELLRTSLGELRRFLAQPATRAEISLGAAPRGARTVWRERPFSLVLDEPDGGHALWSGAFDRVVLHGKPEAWERAVVLDFKTDRVRAEDVEERVEFYRPQLEGYRRVLARMTRLDPGRIEARVLFLSVDQVRSV